MTTDLVLTAALPAADAVPPALDGLTAVREPGRTFSREERADLLRELLLRYPGANVAAVDGSGRFIALPASVTLDGHALISGHDSALELVPGEDVVTVIEAWKTACTQGLGVADVHPLDHPDGHLALYFVDVREDHGVLVGIAVTADGSAISSSRGANDLLRPRLCTVRKTRLAEFEEIDDAFEVILGYSRDEIVGGRSLDLVHPDDQPRAIANWIDLLGDGGSARRVRLRHRHADGHWLWFEVTNHNKLDDPDHPGVVTEMIDISDEMQAQESLRASEQLLSRLTDALPVGVVQIDRDSRVVYQNVRAGQILGSAHTGTLAELFAGVLHEDKNALARAGAAVLAEASDVDLEVGVRGPDGRLVRCRLSLRPLSNDDGVTGAIACIDDITEPARLRAQLELRATYDSLTGCLNRAAVLTELERALEDARADDTGVAVIFVDLDGFKAVNDTRGHTAGDALLQDIGKHLLAAARREDVIGRVGGDEFLVVGRDVGSTDQALTLGQRISDALAADITPQYPHRAVASVGVAWAGSSWCPWLTADDLVAQADRAMYNSKREGSGRPVLG